MDSASWQHGTHFLKFGADIARRQVTFEQARAPRGSFSFDGTYTGSALADFMLGYVRNASINPAHTSTDLWNWWQSYYFNDDWKLTPRLTVNLGMRYDYFQPYTQVDDKFVNIEQNGFIVAGITTPETSSYGRGLIAPDRNNWAPRVGFAYSPTFLNDAVIRGAYGWYYTPQISNAIFAMAEGAQATAGAAVIGSPTGIPNIFFNDPFSSAVTTGALNFAVSNDQNLRDTYIQQWNLNVQKTLPGKILLDVGYIGTKSTTADCHVRGSQPADPTGRSADSRLAVAQCAPSQSGLSARGSFRQIHRQRHLSCAPAEGGAPHEQRAGLPDRLHLVEVDLRTERHRRAGRRRQLHRRPAGYLQSCWPIVRYPVSTSRSASCRRCSTSCRSSKIRTARRGGCSTAGSFRPS